MNVEYVGRVVWLAVWGLSLKIYVLKIYVCIVIEEGDNE